jgi:hypothetical protein
MKQKKWLEEAQAADCAAHALSSSLYTGLGSAAKARCYTRFSSVRCAFGRPPPPRQRAPATRQHHGQHPCRQPARRVYCTSTVSSMYQVQSCSLYILLLQPYQGSILTVIELQKHLRVTLPDVHACRGPRHRPSHSRQRISGPTPSASVPAQSAPTGASAAPAVSWPPKNSSSVGTLPARGGTPFIIDPVGGGRNQRR